MPLLPWMALVVVLLAVPEPVAWAQAAPALGPERLRPLLRTVLAGGPERSRLLETEAAQARLDVEERTLSLADRALPNYPVTAQTFRRGGRYATGYRQTIPPGAAAGTYRFEGEVCVADLCATRSASFDVAP
jgi:hypothetical protein